MDGLALGRPHLLGEAFDLRPDDGEEAHREGASLELLRAIARSFD